MPDYRIYRLNEAERIVSGNDATCENDAEAFEVARQGLAPGQNAEVWSGTRCLGRVAAVEC